MLRARDHFENEKLLSAIIAMLQTDHQNEHDTRSAKCNGGVELWLFALARCLRERKSSRER